MELGNCSKVITDVKWDSYKVFFHACIFGCFSDSSRAWSCRTCLFLWWFEYLIQFNIFCFHFVLISFFHFSLLTKGQFMNLAQDNKFFVRVLRCVTIELFSLKSRILLLCFFMFHMPKCSLDCYIRCRYDVVVWLLGKRIRKCWFDVKRTHHFFSMPNFSHNLVHTISLACLWPMF